MSKSNGPVLENVTQVSNNPSNVDAAWTYLNHHARPTVESGTIDIRRLRRKIDWHIVPIMFCCYTMQFLDKVILNYAAVMGLSKDLHLKGNQFSNIATFLFVGLLCFEVPNSAFKLKAPPFPAIINNIMSQIVKVIANGI